MSDESAVLEKVPKQLLIGGDWVDGSEGTLPVEDRWLPRAEPAAPGVTFVLQDSQATPSNG